MNSYLRMLLAIEEEKAEITKQNPTSENQARLLSLNSRARVICKEYLASLGSEVKNLTPEYAKQRETDLREELFNLRMKQFELGKYPESEAYADNVTQIKVVRREMASLKLNIERGKKK